MEKARTSSGTSTVLIVILVLITFPFWIGILGAAFGLVVGAFGAVIGVFGAMIGAIFGGIGALIGAIFNWGDWDHFGEFGFHFWNGKFFAIMLVTLLVALAIRPRRK